MRGTWLIGEEPNTTHRCFWCGRSCGVRFTRADHVSATFLGFADVFDGSSGYICAGCLRMTDESDRSLRPRMFSWLITQTHLVSAHRGQMELIRGWCMRPPQTDYAIVLATSGKKHLAFLSPVNHRSDIVTVQLEREQVTYAPDELTERLKLCMKLAAATGKPSLVDRPSANMISRAALYFRDFEPLLLWQHVWSDPLSRLAGFLCPKQEICRSEYPSDIPARSKSIRALPAATTKNIRRKPVPAQDGGTDGPGLFGSCR